MTSGASLKLTLNELQILAANQDSHPACAKFCFGWQRHKENVNRNMNWQLSSLRSGRWCSSSVMPHFLLHVYYLRWMGALRSQMAFPPSASARGYKDHKKEWRGGEDISLRLDSAPCKGMTYWGLFGFKLDFLLCSAQCDPHVWHRTGTPHKIRWEVDGGCTRKQSCGKDSCTGKSMCIWKRRSETTRCDSFQPCNGNTLL